MKIRFTPQAQRDLRPIKEYVNLKLMNNTAAIKITQKILDRRTDYLQLIFKDED